MAARTIPFPNPPGNAGTGRKAQTTPPPPPRGAAGLTPASRRYRGLHLVSNSGLRKVSRHFNRLAQTKAIVEQVEREIAQSVRIQRQDELKMLSPISLKMSLPVRAARRLAGALLPVRM